MIALALLLAASPSHIGAARIAGAVYRIEPDLLLAIAEHETTWDATLRNGYACGPMQVVPVDERGRFDDGRCRAMRDPLVGYLEGARALRYFLDVAHGDIKPALRMYGCGWAKDENDEFIRPVQAPPTCNGFDGWVVAHRNAYRREAQS